MIVGITPMVVDTAVTVGIPPMVVDTAVTVGIPPMVVGTAVRVVITVTEALKLWVLSAALVNGASVPPPLGGSNGWIMLPVDVSLAKT
jgi:hypothetical protein